MPVNIKAGHSNFFDIGLEVFGHKVSVMFCDDVKITMANLHPEVGKIDDAEALIYLYTNQAMSELFVKYEAKPGSIAHEAFHAVWNLFKYHGMKHDNESMAYHLGYLIDEIAGAQKEAQEAKEQYARNKELEGLGIVCCLL